MLLSVIFELKLLIDGKTFPLTNRIKPSFSFNLQIQNPYSIDSVLLLIIFAKFFSNYDDIPSLKRYPFW